MFRIGEFSKLTQVTIRMLRYYDECGLLKPAKIDKWTGYRMYSSDQIPILNKIVFLRDSGFNVSEIKELIDIENDEDFINKLDKKYKKIEEGIELEKQRLAKIEMAKSQINNKKGELYCNITLKNIPSYKVLSYRKVVDDYYCEGNMWEEMSEFISQNKLQVSDDTFVIYHDLEYREKDVDIEVCAKVNKTIKIKNCDKKFTYRDTEPVYNMACTMVYGPFSNIKGAYLEFAKWIEQNSNYKMGEKNRQIVHRGPWNEDNPENYVIEIQIPLLKK